MADFNVNIYDRPYQLVADQIQQMSARANDALTDAAAAVAAITALQSPIANILPPKFELPDDETTNELQLDPPVRPDYRPPDWREQGEPGTGADLVTGLENADAIPTFDPPITSFAIPQAPAPIDTSGLPTPPVLAEATLPATPNIVEPELGNLVQINIPTFAGLHLPTFDAVAPIFDKLEPSTVVGFIEPVYHTASLDQLKARVAVMLAGGTGLTPEIEQALFDRSRARVDIEGERTVQEAFDTFAGRGFDMPPGMLVEAVDTARETRQLQINAFARDILTQAAQWEIENLRFAVTQGVALEAQLIGLFNNEAERGFQAAKYRVEADIALYNANVSLFGALNTAYQVKASVFGELIKAELANLDAFKAEIEAQQAIGQVNEQTVRVYEARLRGVTNLVEVYKAQLAGAQTLTDMQKLRVEAYGEGVKAYGERITADKTRFDAYKTQVEGEGVKAQLLESSARAFAATVQAYETRGNIKVQNVRAHIEAMGAATQQFIARIQGERDRVTSLADIIRAQASTFTADVQEFVAQLDDRTKRKQLDITKAEARLRNNIAYYEINVREYDQALNRLLEEMKVRVEALKTVATVTSQIAAGAFAAMHVSAQMQGDARVSDSYERQDRYDFTPET